jgi:hypothetical protein
MLLNLGRPALLVAVYDFVAYELNAFFRGPLMERPALTHTNKAPDITLQRNIEPPELTDLKSLVLRSS